MWVRTWQWGEDSARYTVGIDEKIIPEKRLYGGRSIWKFASEHVWKWVPIWECELKMGKHKISLYSVSSRVRIDQICLKKITKLCKFMVQ